MAPEGGQSSSTKPKARTASGRFARTRANAVGTGTPLGVPLTAEERAEGKRIFLAALAENPNVTKAARAVGVARLTVYKRPQDDAPFAGGAGTAREEHVT